MVCLAVVGASWKGIEVDEDIEVEGLGDVNVDVGVEEQTKHKSLIKHLRLTQTRYARYVSIQPCSSGHFIEEYHESFADRSSD